MDEHPWIKIGRELTSQSKNISSYYEKEGEAPLNKNILQKNAMQQAESEFNELNAIGKDLKEALKSLIKSKTNVS